MRVKFKREIRFSIFVYNIFSGSIKDCTSVIETAFSSLKGRQKWCKILIDEIHIKPSMQYQGGHVVGFSEDQPDEAAKTVLSFMVSPLMGGPAFIARLIPVHSLDHNMIFDQIQQLLKIIHDCSGFVYLVMTDNLRANQSLFQKMHDFYGSKSLWSVNHPINNEEFEELFVLCDPTHLLKNIRNNWVTEKTRTLKFTCPETGRNVVAKWSDLVAIYNEEMSSFIKHTRINYASLYPTNFEKQKVALALNIFNEKTVAALKLRKCDDTALFVEHVTKMWNMLNIKTPHDGTKR